MMGFFRWGSIATAGVNRGNPKNLLGRKKKKAENVRLQSRTICFCSASALLIRWKGTVIHLLDRNNLF
jgi:hypothetical protein